MKAAIFYMENTNPSFTGLFGLLTVLKDGLLVDDVIVPRDDNTVHNISADGDIFIRRRGGLLVWRHEVSNSP